MKELLEKYISSIYIDEDRQYLVFINNWADKFWVYRADGDCCSCSWFESINNPENLFEEMIIGIEIKPETNIVVDDSDCVKTYGYTLKTTKGYTDIEFRNESNGYYGGSCELVKDAKLIYPEMEDILLIANKNNPYKNSNYYSLNYRRTLLQNKIPIYLQIGNSKEKIQLVPYKEIK